MVKAIVWTPALIPILQNLSYSDFALKDGKNSTLLPHRGSSLKVFKRLVHKVLTSSKARYGCK